jgi:hypothetical protein
MNLIESILQQMPGISQPQKKSLVILFSTLLLCYAWLTSQISVVIVIVIWVKEASSRHFLQTFNLP